MVSGPIWQILRASFVAEMLRRVYRGGTSSTRYGCGNRHLSWRPIYGPTRRVRRSPAYNLWGNCLEPWSRTPCAGGNWRTDLKNLYLAAALAGTVVPYYFFSQHFAADGFSVLLFLQALFGNPVAAGGSSDLFISSFVFWIYMFTRGEGAPNPWPFVLLNLGVGLSCAFPLYLYWQEKRATSTVPAI